jgi:hypothetical protein
MNTLVKWAHLELASTRLRDPRLETRLINTVEGLSQRPEASCTEALGDRAAIVGAYRFWNNEKVRPERILQAHAESTARRAARYGTVLAVQDATDFNFTAHPATEGLGYLYPNVRGLLLHSLMAVSPDGVPLGLLRQIMWTRPLENLKPEKKKKSRHRAIDEKETQNWLDGLRAAEETLPHHPHVVVISDSESDIFDLFAAPRRAGVDLLVRACRVTRLVNHPAKYLRAALLEAPVRGEMEVKIPRRGGRKERTAKVTIRWTSLEIRPPVSDRPRRPCVRLQFILVEEVDPPKGVEPIRWILATTMPVRSVEDALCYVQWYTYRWRIERYHFVLKSGNRIEDSQLKSVEAIKRAIATYSIVAWRLLWITYEAREVPDSTCTVALEEFEWKALWAKLYPAKPFPSQPPTLREAVRMVAKLGGFLGRKGDGEPGVKTLWRGLRRLHDISEGWLLGQFHHKPRDASIATCV